MGCKQVNGKEHDVEHTGQEKERADMNYVDGKYICDRRRSEQGSNR